MAKTKTVLPTLERSKLPARISTDKVENLAKQAKNILGYSVLADRVFRPISLAAVLSSLDIEPYKQYTVDEYKEAKLREVKAERKASKTRSYSSPSWRRTTETVKWTMKHIADYTKPVPEFALRKAVQICEAHPDVSIFIEDLEVKRRRMAVRKDYDPFMVAVLGGEKYYIEVWDEKKFEDKLL